MRTHARPSPAGRAESAAPGPDAAPAWGPPCPGFSFANLADGPPARRDGEDREEAGAIQRFALHDIHDIGGMPKAAGTAQLIGNGATVNLYKRTTDAATEDPGDQRRDALVKAAAANGEMGQEIGYWTSKGRWTRNPKDFNQSHVDTLDPFVFDVTVPYPAGPGAEDHPGLTIRYQHAHQFTGYVTVLRDTSNPLLKDPDNHPIEATMYPVDKAGPSRTGAKFTPGGAGGGTPGGVRPTDFSNIHERTGGRNLLDLTKNTKTAATEEQEKANTEGLDAYTKIAGEGARWEAVRRHAANLTDTSYFFTRRSWYGPDDDDSWHPDRTVYCVPFNVLWLCWAATWDKEYNISDESLSEVLRDNDLYKSRQPPQKAAVSKDTLGRMDERDYDLDLGESHDRSRIVNPGNRIVNPRKRKGREEEAENTKGKEKGKEKKGKEKAESKSKRMKAEETED